MYDIRVQKIEELVGMACRSHKVDKSSLIFDSSIVTNPESGSESTEIKGLGCFYSRIPSVDKLLPKQFYLEIDEDIKLGIMDNIMALVYDYTRSPEIPQLVIYRLDGKVSEAHFEDRNNGNSLGFKMVRQSTLKPEYIFVNENNNSIISDKDQIKIIRNYVEAILREGLNNQKFGIDNNLFTIYTAILIQEALIEKASQNLVTNIQFCVPGSFNIEKDGVKCLESCVSNMQENFIMTDHTTYSGGGHFVILGKDSSS